VEHVEQGWQPDPLRRHDERWMSACKPTDLVRDGAEETHDPPDPAAPLPEIDLDQLPTGQPIPFPWRQSPRQRVLVLAAFGCGVVAILATAFGHATDPAEPLGHDEAIGTVVYAKDDSNSTFVMASYAPPDQPSGLAYAEGSVARPVYEGQAVVVRYDASQPTDGTVLSQPTPQSRPNGLYGVFIGVLGFVGFGTLWIVSGYRKWRLYRAREAVTDYREGPWAGTTNSA
jgi:hypothetical protein